MSLRRIAWFLLWLCLSPAAWAQGSGDAASPEEIVERILELQRQIDELLAALPPEVRDEVRRRLAEPATEPAVADTEPVVAEATPEPAAPEPAAPEPAAPEPAAPEPAAPEPAAPEPAAPAASEPAITAEAPATPSSDGIPKLLERRSRRPPCTTLLALDENGDGKVSSADRYWRYVYLWTDRNGDGRLQEREVESAYDRKVREIAVSLETFIRAKGNLGEIRVEDQIVLDLRGDGFSQRSRGDDGVLVVDADALARGDGPRLLAAGGEPLAGYQAFRAGLRLEVAGVVTELSCP